MLAPLGATVAVVLFVVVFPAVASDDVLVSLPPMLAPPGATVVVVVLSVVVVAAPPASTAAGLPVVVAFCGKQADCAAVTFVSLAVGPNDAPPGAGVAAVSLSPPPPPVACTGLTGAAAINVSIIKTAGIAMVVMNLG
jgi:hypothetical protein